MYAHRPLPLKPGPIGQRLSSLRVSIVGLGKSGLAAMEVCLAEGAKVSAFDEKPIPNAALWAEKGVSLHIGPLSDALWQGADAVIVSPGVPLVLPAIASAMSANVPVVGEVELAMKLLRAEKPTIVGITGTNGKSTTTALTGELFRRHFNSVFVGGNLGRPLSEATQARYDALVVELSSFQLEGIVEARFGAAAWLNLTPDHLDRYSSTSAYAAAKARVWANQASGDVVVVNADDAQVMEWAQSARAPVFGFSSSGQLPTQGKALAGWATPTDEGFAFSFGEKHAFRLNNRALRGRHNLENAMAAALLAHLSNVSPDAIQAGLAAFSGLPHRLEFVRELNGVEWINDSKATNVDSSLVALNALKGPLWLILGGKGKGAPYEPMVRAAAGKVKGVFTIGADAKTIEAAFGGVCAVHACNTLDLAVLMARQKATSGDTVLLSPACASYDQFQNFEDRGDRFKAWVRAL